MYDLDELTAVAYRAYVEALIEHGPVCNRERLIKSHCGRKEMGVAELPLVRAIVEAVVVAIAKGGNDHE